MTRLTGADIELAIGEAQPLIDPRLSEVDWDAVATVLVIEAEAAQETDRLRAWIKQQRAKPWSGSWSDDFKRGYDSALDDAEAQL